MPTANQAVEYLLGLLLAYSAIRRTGSTTVALVAIAATTATVPLLSPGKLGLRSILSHRGRRIADLVLAVVCLGAVIGVTRVDVVATGSLIVTALVLMRLGLSRTPEPILRRRSARATGSESSLARRASEMVGDIQPRINRTARVAGAFVHNRRARRGAPK